MFSNVREILILTNKFEMNDFFDKYVQLIQDNEHTVYIKTVTQKHHIIPKSFFKLQGLNYNNRQDRKLINKDNLVVLSYKDHILAHYYLMKCVKDKEIRDMMACAVRWILRRFNYVCQSTNRLEEYQLIELLQEVQDYYKESKHINCLKEDTPSKISKKLNGRISITKDDISFIYVEPQEIEFYYSQGYHKGHNKQTNESKQKISEANYGRIVVNNGQEQHNIKPKELQTYLDQGYVRGQLRTHESAIKGRVCMYNGVKNVYVTLDQVDEMQSKGYVIGGRPNSRKGTSYRKRTEEQRKHYGKSKGRVCMLSPFDNKNHYIKPEEVNQYISIGYIVGSIRNTKRKTKHVWCNNGEIEHFCPIDKCDSFISQGFVYGRLKRRNYDK